MQNRPIKYNFLSNETKIFYLPTSNSFRKYDRFIRDAKLLKFFGMESSFRPLKKGGNFILPEVSAIHFLRGIRTLYSDQFQRLVSARADFEIPVRCVVFSNISIQFSSSDPFILRGFRPTRFSIEGEGIRPDKSIRIESALSLGAIYTTRHQRSSISRN